MSNWGIVYGTSNPHIIAHLENDSEIAAFTPSPGVEMILVPKIDGELSPAFVARISSAVCAACSVSTLSEPRIAVVENNKVVNILHGDVALNPSPNANSLHVSVSGLVAHGMTYDPVNKNFIQPSVTLPAKPGVRATAVVVPQTTVT